MRRHALLSDPRFAAVTRLSKNEIAKCVPLQSKTKVVLQAKKMNVGGSWNLKLIEGKIREKIYERVGGTSLFEVRTSHYHCTYCFTTYVGSSKENTLQFSNSSWKAVVLAGLGLKIQEWHSLVNQVSRKFCMLFALSCSQGCPHRRAFW